MTSPTCTHQSCQRMANLLSKVRSSVLRRKKRRRSAASEEGQVVKKRRKGSASVTEDSLEEGRIAAFVEWCEEVGITLHPKVCWTECVQLQGCVPCHLMFTSLNHTPLSDMYTALYWSAWFLCCSGCGGIGGHCRRRASGTHPSSRPPKLLQQLCT